MLSGKRDEAGLSPCCSKLISINIAVPNNIRGGRMVEMRSMFRRGLTLLVLLITSAQAGQAQTLREILQPDPDDKDPWGDVDLQIESMKCDDKEQCSIRAHGTHKGVTVGLEVVVGFIKGSRRGIVYRSIGSESDKFLAAMEEIYRTKAPSHAFVNEVYADTIFLSGNLAALQGERTEIKVFFYADGPESRYAELYTNIDPVRGILEIHEKDPGYRGEILQALAK
jgi:hypothetical protein